MYLLTVQLCCTPTEDDDDYEIAYLVDNFDVNWRDGIYFQQKPIQTAGIDRAYLCCTCLTTVRQRFVARAFVPKLTFRYRHFNTLEQMA